MKQITIIDNFLKNYNKPNTIRTYKKTLQEYFEILNIKNPDTYFKSNRDYKEDLKTFCIAIKKYTPITFTVKVAVIKAFFGEYEEIFPIKTVKDFKNRNDLKRIKPVIRDKVFSKQELKTILSHAGIREKALFLTLASSGMRIGEALQIRTNDLELEHDPPIIKIRAEYTKNKEARITFCSYEARDYIKEWLKKARGEYIEKFVHCSHNFNKNYRTLEDDNRIFPFTANSGAWKMFQKMLRHSELNKEVDNKRLKTRYEFHLHSFRKFFRTNLAVIMQIDMVEALMGHQGYLTESYRRYQDNPGLMYEPYIKAMKTVTIFETTPDLSGVNKEIENLKKENQKLNEQIKEIDRLLRIKLINKISEENQSKP